MWEEVRLSLIWNLHPHFNMTILQYTSASRIGGAETYLLRLVEVLKSRRHRVLVVARGDSPVEKALREQNVEVYGFHRGGKSPLPLWKLWQLVRREKVDVMHTHLFSAHSRAAWVGNKMSVPTVAHVHALGEPVSHLRSSTRVVAVAHRLRDEVVEQGIASDKVTVIPTGVNTSEWSDLPLPEVARTRLQISARSRPVSVIASLTERKGHRFLLRALEPAIKAEIADEAPIQIIFAGEGAEEENLRELSNELGISERVSFLGFCSKERVRDVLAASEVVALPSLREGLSISVMEAMAANRPVVATAIAGMPELIENGKSGFLVEPENVEELMGALSGLLADGNLRKSVALAGQQRVRTSYEDSQCLGMMADFLEVTAGQKWVDALS
jgi:glycosyltransferase involved in cell wall biosynthesis